jgi:hypothetical protein
MQFQNQLGPTGAARLAGVLEKMIGLQTISLVSLELGSVQAYSKNRLCSKAVRDDVLQRSWATNRTQDIMISQ